MRHADAYGLTAVEPRDRHRARVGAHPRDPAQLASTDDDPERFAAEGVDVLHGAARLTSPTTVRVGDEEHETRYVLLATGSRPATPPIDGLAEAGLPDERADLRARPRAARAS